MVDGEAAPLVYSMFHQVACPAMVYGRARGGNPVPCHGGGKWTVQDEKRAELERESFGTVAAFEEQTCREGYEDFLEYVEQHVGVAPLENLLKGHVLYSTVKCWVEGWLEYEAAEEREYRKSAWAGGVDLASEPDRGASFDMVVADDPVPAVAAAQEKARVEAAARPSVLRFPRTTRQEFEREHGPVQEFIQAGPDGSVRGLLGADGHQFILGVTVKVSAGPYESQLDLPAPPAPKGTLVKAVGEAEPDEEYARRMERHRERVAAERRQSLDALDTMVGAGNVGRRVVGCARCRVRRFTTYCSGCGDRVTSFALRAGESGW